MPSQILNKRDESYDYNALWFPFSHLDSTFDECAINQYANIFCVMRRCMLLPHFCIEDASLPQ